MINPNTCRFKYLSRPNYLEALSVNKLTIVFSDSFSAGKNGSDICDLVVINLV